MYPENIAAAGTHTEVGRELNEGGQTDGGRRTWLGLQAHADNVERCYWEGVLVGAAVIDEARSSMHMTAGEACNIPSSEVRREPVVAESIFWVMEVVTSTGLPMRFGSAGISRAPLPAGEIIRSCDCPCVCSDAILCLSILSSYCCSAPANAGSYRLGVQVGGIASMQVMVDADVVKKA